MNTQNELNPVNPDQICPIRYTLAAVGGKWKLPILCMLADGTPIRYSSIKRKLTGITNMMLAQSLKDLDAAGLVSREQFNEVPPRVEYTLTEKGDSLVPLLLELAKWGAVHLKSDAAGSTFCNTCQTIL